MVPSTIETFYPEAGVATLELLERFELRSKTKRCFSGINAVAGSVLV